MTSSSEPSVRGLTPLWLDVSASKPPPSPLPQCGWSGSSRVTATWRPTRATTFGRCGSRPTHNCWSHTAPCPSPTWPAPSESLWSSLTGQQQLQCVSCQVEWVPAVSAVRHVFLCSHRELSQFIASGRLHCKIDKVGGVVITNRPDSKNFQYQVQCAVEPLPCCIVPPSLSLATTPSLSFCVIITPCLPSPPSPPSSREICC